jgi:hypothetical protein
MKCFTIKSGDEYVADVYRVITNNYWDGHTLMTVGGEEEAKHYKNKSQPKSWIKNSIERMHEQFEEAQANYDEAKQNQNTWRGYTDSYKRKMTSCKKLLKWLEDAEVVELDLEKPNLDREHKVIFDAWRTRNGTAGKGEMKLQTMGQSRYHCKCCGIKLKNIPFYEFLEGNGYKVCIPCLYIRIDAIKSAFEGMPEDFRNSIVNELILGSM